MSTAEAELANFEDARTQFVDAINTVPTEALTYLSPGDDYALGGLVTHVNAVLRRYGRVLDAILADPTADLDARAIDMDFGAENARALEGLTSADRDAAMATLAKLHDHAAGQLATVAAAWDRKTSVIFAGSGGRPYATSPADVHGWLTDHYLEHVPHVAELLAGWRAAGAEA
jgi:hypothetical protein